jgi:protein phosphatase
MRRAAEKANAKVRSLRESMKSDAATTLTMALIKGDHAYISHCGDTRSYFVSEQRADLITEDHKYVAQLVKSGVISPEEARSHPQRNIITSALGMEQPRIDVIDRPLGIDELVLVCSDGLSDLVEDQEIWKCSRYQRYPSNISRVLIDLANRRGGSDNISIAMLVPGSLLFQGSNRLPNNIPSALRDRPVGGLLHMPRTWRNPDG